VGVTGVADADQQVLIPFSTGRFETFGTNRLNDIWVRAVDESSLDAAMVEVQSILRRSHRLRQGQADDFTCAISRIFSSRWVRRRKPSRRSSQASPRSRCSSAISAS
jgi:hypothetical protein